MQDAIEFKVLCNLCIEERKENTTTLSLFLFTKSKQPLPVQQQTCNPANRLRLDRSKCRLPLLLLQPDINTKTHKSNNRQQPAN